MIPIAKRADSMSPAKFSGAQQRRWVEGKSGRTSTELRDKAGQRLAIRLGEVLAPAQRTGQALEIQSAHLGNVLARLAKLFVLLQLSVCPLIFFLEAF